MKLLVLGLTGKRGSGKDTVANYLKEKYGFNVLTYTKDVLGPILKKHGKKIERNNLIDLALELRKEHGKDILTKMIADKVGKDGMWAISGVRYPEEHEHFSNVFGEKYKLINIVCSIDERYNRVVRRGTKGEGKMTLEEFKQIETRETEAMINKTVKLADFTINNNGAFVDLKENTDIVMTKLGLNKSL